MKKHPSAFKLVGELAEKVKTVKDTTVILYEGVCIVAFDYNQMHLIGLW